MLPFPLREAPFILCKMENVFWSVPREGTKKSALKFMVNLGKCHRSVGRKSPKSKPKHTAKCFCVCLTSIWVIALAPWELVPNRRRSGTISLTKKWCPKRWPHSQPWLEKQLSFTWQMLSSKIGERFNWYYNPDALGFNSSVLGTETASSPATSDTSLYKSTLLLKNARWRIQATGLWTF